jgi:hypothetical protein
LRDRHRVRAGGNPEGGLDEKELAREANRAADRLALLPAAVHRRRVAVDDDF